MKEKISWKKEISNVGLILIACLFGAFGMHVFVYPSGFAPMGIDGIATMLQEITHVNAGIYTIVLNVPLFILAWIILKKRYVIYTIVFIVITSLLLIVLEKVQMWQYVTQTDKLIAALFSGIMLGVRTGVMIKIGGSAGGADIIACCVQAKKPYGNVERLISLICYAIMGLSYFVYQDMNCILLSVVQLIVFERVMASVLSPTRNATEVKIVTKTPEQLKDDIIFNLKHGATVVESRGMYTDGESAIVYSVINNRQLPEFIKIIKKYPDAFVYYSDVKGVYGNFRWKKDDIAK
ncbi:MAG: YitT family protein [Clostridia bacterium]|nr:YitT family protein [Clostridia bacterium]